MLIPDTTSFENLLNYFSFVAWIFYGMTLFGVIWLRIRKPNINRPFKVRKQGSRFCHENVQWTSGTAKQASDSCDY